MRILVFLFAAVLGLTACSERIQRSDAPEPQPASAPEAKEPKPASPFRVPGTRDQTTIFTAIDHPDPSSLRLASGIPGPDYWQQRCDYTIEATLDAENREISASAVITYTNNSPHALDYIWLNLEQNLFHPESKGARLTPPGARFGNRDGFEGGFDISLGRLAFIGSSTLGAGSRNASSPPTLRVYDTLGRIDMPRAFGSSSRFAGHSRSRSTAPIDSPSKRSPMAPSSNLRSGSPTCASTTMCMAGTPWTTSARASSIRTSGTTTSS